MHKGASFGKAPAVNWPSEVIPPTTNDTIFRLEKMSWHLRAVSGVDEDER